MTQQFGISGQQLQSLDLGLREQDLIERISVPDRFAQRGHGVRDNQWEEFNILSSQNAHRLCWIEGSFPIAGGEQRLPLESHFPK
jgi:hypothetical protein